nr:DinB family protein [Mucilaginibacter straminoryzae]
MEQAFEAYRNRLDEIPDEEFEKAPAPGVWSAAEVYSHLLDATLRTFMGIDQCCMKTVEHTTVKENWKGKLMMWLGTLSFMRINAPPEVAARVKKITKEEARNKLVKIRRRIEELATRLQSAPEDYRIKHPIMGMLSGKQWFKFCRMHAEHHLKQLDRISKALAG